LILLALLINNILISWVQKVTSDLYLFWQHQKQSVICFTFWNFGLWNGGRFLEKVRELFRIHSLIQKNFFCKIFRKPWFIHWIFLFKRIYEFKNKFYFKKISFLFKNFLSNFFLAERNDWKELLQFLFSVNFWNGSKKNSNQKLQQLLCFLLIFENVIKAHFLIWHRIFWQKNILREKLNIFFQGFVCQKKRVSNSFKK